MNTDTIYKLEEPIQWGSETIVELKFKKPTIGDIKHMKLNNPDFADILGLASRLSGQSQQIIDRLSIGDGMAVVEILGNYLNPSQKTPTKP